jgi:hypothetical protein
VLRAFGGKHKAVDSAGSILYSGVTPETEVSNRKKLIRIKTSHEGRSPYQEARLAWLFLWGCAVVTTRWHFFFYGLPLVCASKKEVLAATMDRLKEKEVLNNEKADAGDGVADFDPGFG